MERVDSFVEPCLRIDLDALAANYRRLRSRAPTAECAAVVKANAYGLGAALVAARLAREGCRTYFVATYAEALQLRATLRTGSIVVLGGLVEPPAAYVALGLEPVLNTPAQVAGWCRHAAREPRIERAIVHVDTGMNRLGLAPAEAVRLPRPPRRGVPLRWLLLSHLSGTDDAGGLAQLASLERVAATLPGCTLSLANSAGIWGNERLHLALVRPGAALYGINPVPGRPNPMQPVARLEAPVLQIRTVRPGAAIGYDGTYVAARAMRIATLGAGYADGIPRACSNRGRVRLGEATVPIVGRVSMDSVCVDASALPARRLATLRTAEIFGSEPDVDAFAAAAGTIAYEILCGIGRRVHRRYGADD